MKINANIETITELKRTLTFILTEMKDIYYSPITVPIEKAECIEALRSALYSFIAGGKCEWICQALKSLSECEQALCDYEMVSLIGINENRIESGGKSTKLDAGTSRLYVGTKNLVKNNSGTFDSNGDPIDASDCNSFDYGHTTGFEKRHLEAFASLIGLSQAELTDLLNSTIMVEVQNRIKNRDHSREEADFAESMKWILMSNWDHLSEEVQSRFAVEKVEGKYESNISYRILYTNKQGEEVLLTPFSLDEIIDERSRKAYTFDSKLKCPKD